VCVGSTPRDEKYEGFIVLLLPTTKCNHPASIASTNTQDINKANITDKDEAAVCIRIIVAAAATRPSNSILPYFTVAKQSQF